MAPVRAPGRVAGRRPAGDRRGRGLLAVRHRRAALPGRQRLAVGQRPRAPPSGAGRGAPRAARARRAHHDAGAHQPAGRRAGRAPRGAGAGAVWSGSSSRSPARRRSRSRSRWRTPGGATAGSRSARCSSRWTAPTTATRSGRSSVGRIGVFHATYEPLLFPTRGFAQPYCYRCPLGLTYPSCDAGLRRHAGGRAGPRGRPRRRGRGRAAGPGRGRDHHRARRAPRARRGDRPVATASCSSSTRSPPASGAPARCSPARQERVEPDLMAVGKGLTGGYLPMSATLTTPEVFDAFVGPGRTFFHGHSYCGNPLAAAVALANLDVFEQEGTLARARAVAGRARSRARALPRPAVRRRRPPAGADVPGSSWSPTPRPGRPSRRSGVSARVCAVAPATSAWSSGRSATRSW